MALFPAADFQFFFILHLVASEKLSVKSSKILFLRMTNYDEDETSWTTLSIVFAVIIATLGYRLFGPDREDVPQEKEPIKVPETKANEKEVTPIYIIF